MKLFLFLSPHLDDAALSCGGLIKRLAHSNQRVVVATIFTADLPPSVEPSKLARRNLSAWNAGPFPFAARKVEDEKAMKMLGAEYVHLDALDAMYRCNAQGVPFYAENTVGVPVMAIDQQEVVEFLFAEFNKIQSQYASFDLHVLSPLSLGGHVDHVIVRKAAEKFWSPSKIAYYEDYPYASRGRVAADWLGSEGKDSGWKFVSVELTPDEISSRIAAVINYTSQLRGLFPSFIERIYEIARARISLLANARLPEDHDASRLRVEALIRKYIRDVGGEKYWFTGDMINLPNEPLQG